MGDLVNLRRARKARTRQSAEVVAGENRARFGQPKSQLEHRQRLKALDTRRLDAHRRDVQLDDVVEVGGVAQVEGDA